jgi:hypothetical protein
LFNVLFSSTIQRPGTSFIKIQHSTFQFRRFNPSFIEHDDKEVVAKQQFSPSAKIRESVRKHEMNGGLSTLARWIYISAVTKISLGQRRDEFHEFVDAAKTPQEPHQ